MTLVAGYCFTICCATGASSVHSPIRPSPSISRSRQYSAPSAKVFGGVQLCCSVVAARHPLLMFSSRQISTPYRQAENLGTSVGVDRGPRQRRRAIDDTGIRLNRQTGWDRDGHGKRAPNSPGVLLTPPLPHAHAPVIVPGASRFAGVCCQALTSALLDEPRLGSVLHSRK